jgi:hypothetical protein
LIPLLFDAEKGQAMAWPSTDVSATDKMHLNYLCSVMESRFRDFPNVKFHLSVKPVGEFDTQAWTCYCLLYVLDSLKNDWPIEQDTMAEMAFNPGLEDMVREAVGNEIRKAKELELQNLSL